MGLGCCDACVCNPIDAILPETKPKAINIPAIFLFNFISLRIINNYNTSRRPFFIFIAKCDKILTVQGEIFVKRLVGIKQQKVNIIF